MAANPQNYELPVEGDEDTGLDYDAAGLPGYTVNALLAQGKVSEAREELERLLLEGVRSGPGKAMTEDLFDAIVGEARARAGRVVR